MVKKKSIPSMTPATWKVVVAHPFETVVHIQASSGEDAMSIAERMAFLNRDRMIWKRCPNPRQRDFAAMEARLLDDKGMPWNR